MATMLQSEMLRRGQADLAKMARLQQESTIDELRRFREKTLRASIAPGNPNGNGNGVNLQTPSQLPTVDKFSTLQSTISKQENVLSKLATRKLKLSLMKKKTDEEGAEDSAGRDESKETKSSAEFLQIKEERDALLAEKKVWLQRIRDDNIKLAQMFKVWPTTHNALPKCVCQSISLRM